MREGVVGTHSLFCITESLDGEFWRMLSMESGFHTYRSYLIQISNRKVRYECFKDETRLSRASV